MSRPCLPSLRAGWSLQQELFQLLGEWLRLCLDPGHHVTPPVDADVDMHELQPERTSVYNLFKAPALIRLQELWGDGTWIGLVPTSCLLGTFATSVTVGDVGLE